MTDNIFGIKVKEVMMPNYEEIVKKVQDAIMPLFDNAILDQPGQKRVKAGAAYYSSLTGARTIYYDVKQQLTSAIDLSPITNFIEEQSAIYWQELKFNPRLKPIILTSWANIGPKGSAVWPHRHSPAHLTAVFYINARPEMGNLVLQNPMEDILAGDPYETTYSVREFDYEVQVQTGKLVIHQGWLKHYVKENTVDEDRFSLAFNIIGAGGLHAALGKDDPRTEELRSTFTPVSKTGNI